MFIAYILLLSGNFEQIVSGFGDNIWAQNSNGEIFRKKSVSSLRPLGAEWKKESETLFTKINAGFTGVFGLTKDGDFAFYKGKDIIRNTHKFVVDFTN